MKKALLFLFLFVAFHTKAQKHWFVLNPDSASLVANAGKISAAFVADVKVVDPNVEIKQSTILNTSPYLIYWDDSLHTVNIPMWSQVIPPQQEFFYKLAGSQESGKMVFGLFFNGFYLVHELGHAVEWSETAKGNKMTSSIYESEEFANELAILYWRKKGFSKELKECYDNAKIMLAKLDNPVPKGEDMLSFFSKNYEELTQDPYKYGYFQFDQFVRLYDASTKETFEGFLKAKLK
jgi:hypothetical protein